MGSRLVMDDKLAVAVDAARNAAIFTKAETIVRQLSAAAAAAVDDGLARQISAAAMDNQLASNLTNVNDNVIQSELEEASSDLMKEEVVEPAMEEMIQQVQQSLKVPFLLITSTLVLGLVVFVVILRHRRRSGKTPPKCTEAQEEMDHDFEDELEILHPIVEVSSEEEVEEQEEEEEEEEEEDSHGDVHTLPAFASNCLDFNKDAKKLT